MATITGKVFHDLNHDGQYTANEPGIPGVTVMLCAPNSCISFLTDDNGDYNFTVVDPGTYTIYETATNLITACPPVYMTQPTGYTMSNGPRKQTITVSEDQIRTNETMIVPYFSHDTGEPSAQQDSNKMLFSGKWYDVDRSAGTATQLNALPLPDGIGAVIYHPQDQFLYGYDKNANQIVRMQEDGTIFTLSPRPEGLPSLDFTIGALDTDGFYYLAQPDSARFYTVDLRADSPTFMKLVDPSDHTEQTESFGTALIASHLQNWVSSPMDHQLYGIDADALVKINPANGTAEKLFVTGKKPEDIGALSIDTSGTLYGISNSRAVYQYTLEENAAYGRQIASEEPARSATTLLAEIPEKTDATAFMALPQENFDAPQVKALPVASSLAAAPRLDPGADLAVYKIASPDPVLVGGVLQYTVVVTNRGSENAENVQLTDTAPTSLTNVEFSTDGTSWTTWSSPYTLGTVNSGSAVEIYLRGTVNNTATDSISNTASVTSTTQDPDPSNNSTSVTTTVTTSADLSVQKTGNPTLVNPGDQLTYTIAIQNAGPSDAQTVQLTDTVPATLTNPEYSTDNGANWSSWTGTYQVGTMALNTTQQILLRATVDGAATGTISNTASVTSATPDPDATNNTATAITAVGTEAGLTVTQTASPTPATAGQTLTYTINIANAGPNDAQNVVLTDTVPSNFTNPEFSTDNGTTWNSWVSPYTVGTITNGQTSTIQIRGTLDAGATGTISNTASVTSDTPDTGLDTNTSTTVTAIGTEANLSITKTAAPTSAVSGQTLTYTITVQNAGPDTADNVTINDQLPQTITGGEFSTDNGATWNPWTGTHDHGSLANGASFSIQIRGTVSSQATGTIANTASVTSTTPDTEAANNTVTVNTPITPQADLTVTKTADKTEAVPGDLLQYTVTVSNQGPSDAANVTMIDNIYAGFTQPEYSEDNGTTWNTWTGSHLETAIVSGGNKAIQIRGRLDPSATGQIDNTAVTAAATVDPDLTNNTVNLAVPVAPAATSADLSITKTASPASVTAGQQITYTLTATNLGPDAAENVAITDTLSASLTNAQYSEDNGTTWNPWTGSSNLGTVNNGATSTILIRADVAVATAPISNTATISSTTADPNPANNTVTINTPITETADLSMTKTADATVVTAGDTLTYTLTVQNLGVSNAQNVSVTDDPQSLTSPEFSIDNGVTWNPWVSPYAVGVVDNLTTRTILLRGTVTAGTGDIENTASVTSTTPDPDPTNNTSTVTVQRTQAPAADLSVQKTALTTPLVPGDEAIYEITIQNNGNLAADNVVIYDNFESSFSDTEISTDNDLTWQTWTNPYTIGTVPEDGVQTLRLRGTLHPTASGSFINTATVTTTSPDLNLANNTVSIQTPIQETANLSVTKQPDHSPVHTGDMIIYTLTVSNAGPADARNVVLNDPLDNAQFSIDDGITWQTWNGSHPLGTLANGESVRVLVRTCICQTQGADVVNTAIVTSTTVDPDLSNNTVTLTVPFEATADLRIFKKLNQVSTMPCQRVSYQVTIENHGPDTAENVVVTEEIPPELCNVQFSIDGGRTWFDWTGVYQVGTMPPGAWLTILFCGNVRRLASGRIDISTTIYSPVTLDPRPENNSITGTIRIIRCCMPRRN